MKRCGKCKEVMDLSNFRFKNKEKTLYQSYCIECNKQKQREHYIANKPAYKAKKIAHELSKGGPQAYRHGLSAEKLESLYSKFDGLCWNCKDAPARYIDHDHSCCPSKDGSCGNCVRGVLCAKCNTGLGLLGDSIEGLTQALAYLTAAAT